MRGEGCYVWDEHGKRYLDGLSALFCVNAGHGRAELGEAAAAQAEELGFYTNWSYAHPRGDRARRADRRRSRRATSTACSSPPAAPRRWSRRWKLARAVPPRRAASRQRDKVIAREIAYHGTTLGRARGHRHRRRCARRSSRSRRAAATCRTRTRYRWRRRTATRCGRPTRSRSAIQFEGPTTVAAVILEPVQNAGGCFVPPEGYFQRVREICDRHGVLLISDEVICAWGRLGHWFGCERYDYLPDIITTAKGLTSAYAPMGAVIASDRLAEPFLRGHGVVRPRHHVRRPPGRCAVALANLDIFEREDLLGHVRAQRGRVPRASSRACATCRSSATCAARATSARIELVKDQETQGALRRRGVARSCCAASCPPQLYERGLICRADDRGDPVIQLSPPLIAGTEQFEEIEAILRAGAHRGLGADASGADRAPGAEPRRVD